MAGDNSGSNMAWFVCIYIYEEIRERERERERWVEWMMMHRKKARARSPTSYIISKVPTTTSEVTDCGVYNTIVALIKVRKSESSK